MSEAISAYMQAYNGYLVGIRKWEDLDAFWQVIRGSGGDGWYIYAVGETPPHETAPPERLNTFVAEIDILLRQDHDEDYCGIVYVDDRESPGFVKVYDPNNLGVVCGSSSNPPLPGWTLSRMPPDDLHVAFPPPGNRRRWWRRLFGQA